MPAQRPTLDDRLRLLGTAVREARLRQGLSQEDLASRAELHRTYVGGIERGERNITLASAYAVADALHVKLVELVAP